MPGKLFLHIGRNRSGSTTLQNTWLRHADALQAANIQYALFGQESLPGHDLPGFSSHMALMQYLEDRPSASVLVSQEALCCFQRDFAKAMAANLARLDVTLIFYVRPYRDWVVSNYVFNVLIGEQAGDFDAYLDELGERASFWPALETWGDEIGWDRVRVRSLHPDDLVAGDLAVDGMAAIGLAPSISAPSTFALAPRDNASPAWVSTELIRLLLAGPSGRQRPIELYSLAAILRTGEVIDHEVRRAAASEGVSLPRGAYLTADQSVRLCEMYNHDLGLRASRTGRRLRRDDRAGEWSRNFLPCVDHAPPGLLRALQDGLSRPSVREALGSTIGERRLGEFLTRRQLSP